MGILNSLPLDGRNVFVRWRTSGFTLFCTALVVCFYLPRFPSALARTAETGSFHRASIASISIGFSRMVFSFPFCFFGSRNLAGFAHPGSHADPRAVIQLHPPIGWLIVIRVLFLSPVRYLSPPPLWPRKKSRKRTKRRRVGYGTATSRKQRFIRARVHFVACQKNEQVVGESASPFNVIDPETSSKTPVPQATTTTAANPNSAHPERAVNITKQTAIERKSSAAENMNDSLLIHKQNWLITISYED